MAVTEQQAAKGIKFCGIMFLLSPQPTLIRTWQWLESKTQPRQSEISWDLILIKDRDAMAAVNLTNTKHAPTVSIIKIFVQGQ